MSTSGELLHTDIVSYVRPCHALAFFDDQCSRFKESTIQGTTAAQATLYLLPIVALCWCHDLRTVAVRFVPPMLQIASSSSGWDKPGSNVFLLVSTSRTRLSSTVQNLSSFDFWYTPHLWSSSYCTPWETLHFVVCLMEWPRWPMQMCIRRLNHVSETYLIWMILMQVPEGLLMLASWRVWISRGACRSRFFPKHDERWAR